MSPDVIARLENLVDRLLSERGELQQRCHALSEERTRLLDDRERVHKELDGLLTKLDELEGKGS